MGTITNNNHVIRNDGFSGGGGGSGEGGVVIIASDYYTVESQYHFIIIPLIDFEQFLNIVDLYEKGSHVIISNEDGNVFFPVISFDEDKRTVFAQFDDLGTIAYYADVDEEMMFPYIVERGAMRKRVYVVASNNFVLFPNEYTIIKYVTSTVNVTLASHPSEDTYYPFEYEFSQEYILEFTTGNVAPQVTFPSSIKWANPLIIAPNTKYQISILNGIALYTSVEA